MATQVLSPPTFTQTAVEMRPLIHEQLSRYNNKRPSLIPRREQAENLVTVTKNCENSKRWV